jgi:hypothetical protein
MGFKRHLKRAILPIALLFGGTGATAATSAQSGWTPLPDANAGFVPAGQQASSDRRTLDQFIANFSAEIARAIAVKQQENDAACKASAAVQHSAVLSADWQASCRYRRY